MVGVVAGGGSVVVGEVVCIKSEIGAETAPWHRL